MRSCHWLRKTKNPKRQVPWIPSSKLKRVTILPQLSYPGSELSGTVIQVILPIGWLPWRTPSSQHFGQIPALPKNSVHDLQYWWLRPHCHRKTGSLYKFMHIKHLCPLWWPFCPSQSIGGPKKKQDWKGSNLYSGLGSRILWTNASSYFPDILRTNLMTSSQLAFYLNWLERCTGIAEIRASTSGMKPDFFRFSFRDCISCVFTHDDLLCIWLKSPFLFIHTEDLIWMLNYTLIHV